MNKFIVQLLDDKEFDNLPFRHVKNAIGCADPESGMAFVRRTGIPLVDMTTLEHEVNHLIEKHGGESADLDGIYYKSKSNFFSQVFGGGGLGGVLGDVAAVALAPFTGGASLGFLPLASAAGGAIQNAIQGQNPLTGALKGFGVGGIASGIGGGLLGAAQGIGGGLSGIGSGLVSGAEQGANTFISGIPGFGAGGALNAATGLGGASFGAGSGVTGGLLGIAPSSLATPGTAAANAAAASVPGTTFASVPGTTAGSLGSLVPAFNAATPAGGAVAPATGLAGVQNFSLENSPLSPGNTNLLGTPTPTGLSATTGVNQLPSTAATAASGGSPLSTATTSGANPLSGLLKNPLALGAGLLGASSLIPSPSFQLPQQVGQLESQLASGQAGGPLGQSSSAALQGIISSPPGALSPALQANDPYFASTFQQIDQNFQNAKAQLDASYNSAGQLGSGEYQDQLRQLTQNTADQKNQYVAQENQRRQELGQQEQLSAIQSALGLSAQQTQELVGLTGLDVQAAALKYGVSASDVTALRNTLGTVGGNLLGQGLGVNTSPTIQLKLA